MIALPFIYFSILLIVVLKKKRTFDVDAYLISLFLFTSLFSILIDIYGLRSYDTQNYQISLVPAVLYCFLLTLTIWPFHYIKSKNIHIINLGTPKYFKLIVYLFFFCFVFLLFSSFDTLQKVLNGDVNELRRALYRGDSVSDLANVSGILRPFLWVANVFGGFSIVMLLFYFYSICFLKNSRKFNVIILVSSFTLILIGILGVDRSKTVYWLLTYGFMLVLFWRHMTGKQKRNIFKVSTIIFTMALTYIFFITISRFGERESGTEGGIISYLGQSYVNFCFFYDEVNFNHKSLQRVFPFGYKIFIENGIEGSTELNNKITFNTGKFVGVFSTFLGDIMVASGTLVTIWFCVIYNLISSNLLKRRSPSYFYELLLIFCLATLPLYGLFVHFYSSFQRTLALWSMICYVLYLKISKLRRKSF